jgi:hypothetical protein
MELFQASEQWASRPDEERFTSLHDMSDKMNALRSASRERVIASRAIEVQPVPGSQTGLVLAGQKSDKTCALTHYSFGQLCQRAGAPAGYLRSLHPALVADNLNYGLRTRDVEEIGTLITRLPDGTLQLRAGTGPNYGRIWNATVVDSLVNVFGDGVTGNFRVPGIRKHALSEVTKANTTLYASDRDMFVFLADEEHRIELPNRRDGKPGSLARGFFVWNSEVGATTLGVATLLFDEVCQNRIVWGATQFNEIRIRHTAKAPHRFAEEIAPALLSFTTSSTINVTKSIEDARAHRLDNVDDFLAKRFAPSLVPVIKAAHVADEGRPIETAWDAVTGATAYARSIPYQADRIAIEEKAGLIIDV